MNASRDASGRRSALFFASAGTVLWTALWLSAQFGNGEWAQQPNWDCANYHAGAMLFHQKLVRGGLGAFADAWVSSTGVHPPFVQMTAALWMFVAGTSRIAAETVLIGYTFAFLYFTFRIVDRLFDRKTAAWSTALAFSFPVAVSVSRWFLLEHPMSAVFAAACWSMIRSDYFSRTGPALAFGILAGFGSLSRLMGMVYFVGPGIVMLYLTIRQPGVVPRLARFALAVLIAIAVSASWYVPNFHEIRDYIGGATIGSRSAFYTGGVPPLSWESARYYLIYIIYEGPGIPMAFCTALAVALLAVRGRFAAWIDGRLAALLVLFAIDFCLLFPSGQRVGARYFLPVLPIVAIAIVRAMIGLGGGVAARWLRTATVVLALFPVVAITFLIRLQRESPGFTGESIAGFQLWDYRSLFRDLAESVAMNPRADMKIPEVIDLAEKAGVPDGGMVLIIAEHPYFQAPALRLESLRRGHIWNFGAPEMLVYKESAEYFQDLDDMAASFDYVIARTGGINYANDNDFSPIVRCALASGERRFDLVGDPLLLGDGSTARVFRRRDTRGVAREMPAEIPPVGARFSNGIQDFELAGFSAVVRKNRLYIKTWLRADRPVDRFPLMFLQFQIADLKKRPSPPDDSLSGREFEPWTIDAPHDAGQPPRWIYAEVDTAIADLIEKCPGEEVTIAVGFIASSPGGPRRMACKAPETFAVDDNNTRLTVAKVRIPDAAVPAPARK